MRVPEYRRQISDVVPSERVQTTVPDLASSVYSAGASKAQAIAGGLKSLSVGVELRQEKQDQFQLASAVNEFRRANTEFLHAKDTGVFAKKGKDVFGISRQYDGFSSKTMEDIAKRYKMNDRVRQAFMGSTNALRDASLSSVMGYERRETDAARELEWKAMADEALNGAALCAKDDGAFGENLETGLGAVAQQYAPYGDEVVGRKLKEFASKCQASRIATMLEDDPRAAEAYLKSHEGEFMGADLLRLKKAVSDRMDVIKVQEMTDGLVRRFGSESAALAHVRQRYEGDMENKLVTAVKTRFGEMRIAQNEADRITAQRQKEAFATLRQDYWDKGLMVPPELLQGMYKNDRLSVAGYDCALSYNSSLSDRAGKILWAKEHIKGWGSMSLDQQDAELQKLFGYSRQDLDGYAKSLYRKALYGELNDDDVKLGYNYCMITSREKAKVEAALKSVKAADKATFALEQKRVSALLKDAKIDVDTRMENEKQTAAAIAELNPTDPDYREKGLQTIVNTAASMLSERNSTPWYDLYDWGWWGTKYDKQLHRLKNRAGQVEPDRKNDVLGEALSFLLPKKERDVLLGKAPKVFADAVSALGAESTPKKKTPPPPDRDDEDDDMARIIGAQ